MTIPTKPSAGGLYEFCHFHTEEGDTEAMMKCAIDLMEGQQNRIEFSATSYLLILSGALVFFMQAGFAMLCAGSVRKKNTHNTMLKNLLDACGAAIAYFCVGFAFAFGGDSTATGTTFIGTTNFFGKGDISYPFFFFQYTFAAAAVTIVAGALAERCQMAAYLCYSFFLTGFVYPVVAHAVWSVAGFLSFSNPEPLLGIGMIDFAGSAVIHLTGGTTALISTYLLGSRRGRFYDLETGKELDKPKPMPGHSVSLQVLGTFILWFGWFGFNGGSALLIPATEYQSEIAAVCAINTFLASSSGCIASMLVRLIKFKRSGGHAVFDLTSAMNGTLCGLVAITAGCGTLEPWGAIIVGLVAGIMYPLASDLLIWLKIDDVVDAIPVHFVGGLWGALAVGLLSEPELTRKVTGTSHHPGFFYSLSEGHSDARLLGCQTIGVLCIIGWNTVTMLPFFLGLHRLNWFRTEAVEEIVGLDLCFNDLSHHKGEDIEQENQMRDEYLVAYEEYKLKQVQRKKHGGSTSDARSIRSGGSGISSQFVDT
ncbi:Ammonium transporter 1 member [Seminavis robusta]|uniref:Ammonium transporter n=1 Tax=Seminavis robusta TaxID=568900 RepID=A0A9N8HPU2_9STRA|nr:Ammonium transporter 1 member [Seminavis robusta]|eukprot:Sro1209_g252670.1 Ammonium transporter 1 member (537) ;mRNA; r:18579-20570